MNTNSEYMIPVSHPKFMTTWTAWTNNIMAALHKQTFETDDLGFDYLCDFDFTTHMPTRPLENEIPRRIYQEVGRMRGTLLETSWVGYDTEYAPHDKLSTLLTNFMQQRKRTDYQIFATSAFSITNSLDIELLDYPIPRINIMCISFTGERNYL